MGDGQGLVDSLRRVCKKGRESGYVWFERYNEQGHPFGNTKYCEYPANLIRIVQRFVLGVEFGLDGAVVIAPTVPDEFWKAGFGQTLAWRGRTLSYRMQRNRMTGDYHGPEPQRLCVRLSQPAEKAAAKVTINGQPAKTTVDAGKLVILLPASPAERPCHLNVEW